MSKAIDYLKMLSKAGFMMRLRIGGTGLGSLSETFEDRAILDAEEAKKVSISGNLGDIYWAPKMSLTKCGDVFNSDTEAYDLAKAFNMIRIVGQRARVFFNGRTIPFGGESFRLVMRNDAANVLDALADYRKELMENAEKCAANLQTLVSLQIKNVEARILAEAMKQSAVGKIDNPHEHATACLRRIRKRIPTAEQFRDKVYMDWLCMDLQTPEFMKDNPNALESSKEQVKEFCENAGTFVVEKILSIFQRIQSNKSIRCNTVSAYRTAYEEFNVLNEFVGNTDAQRVVEDFNAYLATVGLDATDDKTLEKNVAKVRKEGFEDFKDHVNDAIEGLESVSVTVANPFGAAGEELFEE